MTELSIDNLIEDWEETIGLTIKSVEYHTIDFDDTVDLFVVHFNNGKFVIQRDQSYHTTTCGLVEKRDFSRHMGYIKMKK